MHLTISRAIFAFGLGMTIVATSCKDPAPQGTAKKDGGTTTDADVTTTTGGSTSPNTMDTGTGAADPATAATGGTGTTTGCVNVTGVATYPGTSAATNTGVAMNTGVPVSSGLATASTGVGTVDSGTSGLGLTDAVFAYNPDIQTFIATRCGACHGPAQSPPQLDQYTLVKANALNILPAIETDQGLAAHANLVTTSAERAKFRAWVMAGAPETLNALPAGTMATGLPASTGVATNIPYDPCNPTGATGVGGTGFVTTGVATTGTPTGTVDPWNDLVNPPLLATCRNQGLIYDRSLEKCHKARISTTYSCDRNGILAKFKAVNVDVTPNYDSLIASGYVIDQCGEFNNEPVVLFYQKQEGSNELRLLYKKFCKMGSAACGD